MSSGSLKREIVVILVHGTWAKSAAWTRPGSALRTTFERRLRDYGKVTFRVFIWSGSNTHSARVQAGRHLQDEIRVVGEALPNCKLFVVGHSHGGNVALYAARVPHVASRLTGIVTLATPFIYCSPRRVKPAIRLAIVGLRSSVALVWAAAPLVLVDTSNDAQRSVLAVYLISALFGLALAPPLVRPFSRKLFRRIRHSQCMLANTLALPNLDLPILAVTYEKDEAAAHLATMHRMTSWPFAALQTLTSKQTWIVFALMTACLSITLYSLSNSVFSVAAVVDSLFLAGGLLTALVCMFILFLAASLLVGSAVISGPWAFGESNPLKGLFVRSRIGLAPPGPGVRSLHFTRDTVAIGGWFAELRLQLRALRHSWAYVHEPCLAAIGTWIAGLVSTTYSYPASGAAAFAAALCQLQDQLEPTRHALRMRRRLVRMSIILMIVTVIFLLWSLFETTRGTA